MQALRLWRPWFPAKRSIYMVVHMVLLAVPAVAGGGFFLQAFQFAFLLWPFNLALPLARQLPRSCIALRWLASFYAAELGRYVSGARRGAQLLPLPLPPPPPPPPPRRSQQYASSPLRGGVRLTHEDVVAHAMVALIDMSY